MQARERQAENGGIRRANVNGMPSGGKGIEKRSGGKVTVSFNTEMIRLRGSVITRTV
jgi:hypothetical protein